VIIPPFSGVGRPNASIANVTIGGDVGDSGPLLNFTDWVLPLGESSDILAGTIARRAELRVERQRFCVLLLCASCRSPRGIQPHWSPKQMAQVTVVVAVDGISSGPDFDTYLTE
jgi:hypothetical protein